MAVDGSITINTNLETGDAEKDLVALHGSIKKAASAMESIGRSSQRAFESARLKVEETKLELEALQKKQSEVEAKAAAEYAGFNVPKAKRDELIQATLDTSPEYQKLQGQIERTILKLDQYTLRMERAKETSDSASASLERLRDSMSETGKEAAKTGASTKKATKDMKKMKDATIPLSKSLLTVGKMFKLMLLRMVIRATIQAVRQGFRDLAQYSAEFNRSMSALSTATLQARNSLTTAFAPALQAITPMILNAVNALVSLFNMMGMLSARVFGNATTFTKAKKAQVDYAKSVAGTNKAAKEQLAAFDELNVLAKDQGQGAEAGVPTPADMFEEVEIPENVVTLGDRIKETFGAVIGFVRENLNDILRLVVMIGAGILAWNISRAFGASLSTAAGVLLAVAGAVGAAMSAFDMLENGVNWNNLLTMLISVASITVGLTILFGLTAGAIGLLLSGVAMLAIGMYDWIKNGELSTETFLLLEAAIIAVGIALAILIGWPALIVAALVGLGLAVYKFWDEIVIWTKEAWEKVKEIWGKAGEWFRKNVVLPVSNFFKVLWEGIKNAAIASWDGIKNAWNVASEWFMDVVVTPISNFFGSLWEGIKTGGSLLADFMREQVIGPIIDLFKGMYNAVVGIMEGMVNGFIGIINGFISGINMVIDTINRIPGVNLPSISTMPTVQIPRLATGAVIPPNAEFLAILGDQKHGRNIEAPEGLIRQIVSEELANLPAPQVTVVASGNTSEIIRFFKFEIDKEDKRQGRALIQGV